jgi:hypothetical protein
MNTSAEGKLKNSRCEELVKIVRDAAANINIKTLSALSAICTHLTYEQVMHVWYGEISNRIIDVKYVLNILNINVRWK